jgi:hypothetical protein
MRKLTLTLFSGLLMATFAASNAAAEECRKKITLQPTAAGNASDISGASEVRARGEEKRFKVSMDARVADGTVYVVRVDNSVVGTISISFGDGELELNTNDGAVVPPALSQVCTAGYVSVTDAAGTPVLTGNF